MKIQFDIKEKLPEIISEILHSDKWQSIIELDNEKLKKVVVKDLSFNTKVFIEIWEKEIHIKTPHATHTYRIFKKGNISVCEYIGAKDGLLKQNLLPRITPVKTIEYSCEDSICAIKSHKRYQSNQYNKKDEYIIDWGLIPSVRN